jgi:threonyl-tRNA synthetase
MERFTSILIEHFAGNFPLWLSPEQIRFLPISDTQNEQANEYAEILRSKGVRLTVDDRSEQIGAKIRDAETAKIPYMVIIGAKEMENGTVSVRKHRKGDIGTFNFSDFLSQVTTEISEKTLPED